MKTSITIVSIWFLVFLAACSRDTSILGDYKLYDLDGSNQAIIGNAGSVNISDVTAYDVSGRKIIFETGAVGIESDKSLFGKFGMCRYGFIDLTKNSIVYANPNSDLYKKIYDKLKLSREGTVSRSCVGRIKL